ncbi:hypothetical protein GCM10022259_23140 [Aquimarina mytili]
MGYEGSILQKNTNNFQESIFKFKGNLSSVFTGNSERDEHLCSEDFFDVKNDDFVRFNSTSVNQIDETHYFIVGILILKGNSKSITITGHYKGKKKGIDSKYRIGFEFTALIERTDFGINWHGQNEEGSELVSDQIRIHIHLQLFEKHIKNDTNI